ncbi:MAG: winged helix-turn-helix domain-containing protein [Calditrichaeota bacterium]|nr:winged helix-turn-helix domain-containing protein [Calditrichota bacterium]
MLCINHRFYLDTDASTIISGKNSVHVPPKFFEVLIFLVQHAGQVVSRRMLFDALWTDTIVVDESLTRAVSELRKIFKSIDSSAPVIETIPKKGYRFVGHIEDVSVESTELNHSRSKPFKQISFTLAIGMIALFFVINSGSAPMDLKVSRDTVPLTSLPGSESEANLSQDGNHLLMRIMDNNQLADGIYQKTMRTEEIHPLQLGANLRKPKFLDGENEIAFLFDTDSGSSIRISSALGYQKRIHYQSIRHIDEYAVNRQLDIIYISSGQAFLLDRNLKEKQLASDKSFYSACGFINDELVYLLNSSDQQTVIETYNLAKPYDHHEFSVPLENISNAFPLNQDNFICTGANQIYLYNLKSQQYKRIHFIREQMENTAFTSTNRTLYFNNKRENENIWDLNLADGKKQKRIESTMLDFFPRSTPNRDEIAFISTRCGNYNIWLSHSDSVSARPLTLYRDGRIFSIDLSDSGEFIAYQRQDENGNYTINLVHRSSSNIQELFRSHDPLSDLKWIAESTLLHLDQQQSAHTLNTESGESRKLPIDSKIRRISRDINKNQLLLVFESEARMIYSFDMNNGKRRLFHTFDSAILSLDSDGSEIYAGVAHDNRQSVYRLNADGSAQLLYDRLDLQSTFSVHKSHLYYSTTEAVESDIFLISFSQ